MKAWSATAHAIAIDNPGLDHKFRVPRGENDEILIAAARAFATDAVPLSAQFIAHETPITLTGTRAGEYGFLPPGALTQANGAATLGKMYTFSVAMVK